MDCGACEAMVRAVRQHYAFLFVELGFWLAYCEAARKGEHCLIVLESEQARLKFVTEQGTPVAYFGTLDSPIGWANQVDGVPVWFADNALLNFVEHWAEVAGVTMPTAEVARTTEQLLADGAARLRPHAAELVAAFAPDRQTEWWRDFNSYQAERLRQMRLKIKNR